MAVIDREVPLLSEAEENWCDWCITGDERRQWGDDVARGEEISAVKSGELLNSPPSEVADVLSGEELGGQGTTRGESWGADQVIVIDQTRVALSEAGGFHFLVPYVWWVELQDEPCLFEQFSTQRVERDFAGLDAAAWGRPDHLRATWTAGWGKVKRHSNTWSSSDKMTARTARLHSPSARRSSIWTGYEPGRRHVCLGR